MCNTIINQFFYKDGKLISGKKRISTYLAVKRDLMTIMVNDKRTNLGLSYLTNISLICSCTDLLSKVAIGRQPKRGESKKIFTDFLISYCDLSLDQSVALWNLRNSTMHAYTIDSVKGIILYGSDYPIEISRVGEQKQITFNLRKLYSSVVVNSAERLKTFLFNSENKEKIIEYIERNGFYYRRG